MNDLRELLDNKGFDGNDIEEILACVAAASPGMVSADILQQFPVKREWAHDKLENVLIGAAGLLDVIKGEWAEEWSEWDQSVRNGITLQLAALHPSGQASEKP